eukprot:scaffold31210_cov110-Isochrysis_galbana.AAC.3
MCEGSSAKRGQRAGRRATEYACSSHYRCAGGAPRSSAAPPATRTRANKVAGSTQTDRPMGR